MSTAEKTTLSRQYAKLCDRRDFGDPDLLDAIRSPLSSAGASR